MTAVEDLNAVALKTTATTELSVMVEKGLPAWGL